MDFLVLHFQVPVNRLRCRGPKQLPKIGLFKSWHDGQPHDWEGKMTYLAGPRIPTYALGSRLASVDKKRPA